MTDELSLSAVRHIPPSLRQELTRRLSRDLFHAILSYPMWNYIRRAVATTRSYEAGLDAALILLQLAGGYRHGFTPEQHARQMQDIYQFILWNLHKLDRWEDYLRVWHQIRQNTDYALTYSKGSRQFHGRRIEPFVLREDSRFLYVHFLYNGSHRKALIERKLARKKGGSKIGNLLHSRQSELTQEQIRLRMDWLLECYRSHKSPGPSPRA